MDTITCLGFTIHDLFPPPFNYPFVDYNLWLKLLDTQINKPNNQKPLKVVKPANKKMLLYFGDLFNKQPIVPFHRFNSLLSNDFLMHNSNIISNKSF